MIRALQNNWEVAMDPINGSPRNAQDDVAGQLGNLNIGAERQVPLPTQVGYYLQRELETTPYPLNMTDYQLDRELIREINNQNGYRFTGTAVDYQQENDYNDGTVLPFFHQIAFPIFARGGNLCDFLMGTGITPVSTLEFDYNEKENILRFMKPKIQWDIRSFEFSKVGEHRLTGDKSEVVNVGKESSYKVMELITDEYELYYSKEVDGFDGEEPIEIRGVMKDLGLKGIKLFYRSVALADIIKTVVMISEGEGDERIHKVSIIDDFSRHDLHSAKDILFKELKMIFSKFIPIFKRVKKGEICKATGGMIIIPEAASTADFQNAEILCQAGFTNDLWDLFKVNGSLLERKLVAAVSSERKLYLCLKNPETFVQLFESIVKNMTMESIIACFFEYTRNPVEPWKEITNEKPYLPVRDYWRKTIQDRNPELLMPLPLKSRKVCTFSPFIHLCPYINDYIPYNNTTWVLSSFHNVLVGQNRYDMTRLLNTLSTPLAQPPRRVSMAVYTQEPCEDLLRNFFGSMITFMEPPLYERIIFCTIHQIPADANFRTTVFNALNIEDVDSSPTRNTAGLYLISREDTIGQPLWDNKVDLQLLENFHGLDPIRKFPQKVVLFSKDQAVLERVREILEMTHELESEGQYPWIFNSFPPQRPN